MISNGTTVTKKSTILKIIAPDPAKSLWMKSRVKSGSVPAACSNANQKNTVSIEKITTATIRSLTIGAYLGIRMINSKAKESAANMAKKYESVMPNIVKFNV